MAKTYSEYVNESSSRKLVLAHIEPAQRLLQWENITTGLWRKLVDFYVINLEEDGVALTEVTSIPSSNGEWYFDDKTKYLYVRATGGGNPEDVFTTVTYRLFFANLPVDLPYDLGVGREVHYEPRILSNSQFGSRIENDDQIGISLEGSGQIALMNNDNYFSQYYDKLFWEYKNVTVYSHNEKIAPSSAQKIYEGIIQSKAWAPAQVSFQMRDFTTELRNEVPLRLYASSDGDFPDSIIGKPKRRIYGRVGGLRPQNIQQNLIRYTRADGEIDQLDGFETTGTWTGIQGTATFTGVGTAALDELTPEDKLYYIDEFDEQVEFTIKKVNSDTSVTLAETLDRSIDGLTLYVETETNYRKRSRRHLIAGHKISEFTAEVTSSVELNRIFVDDASEYRANDYLTVDVQGTNFTRQVKRISGNQIVFRQSLPGLPAVGALVSKSGVTNVFIGERRLNRQRDFTIDNTGTDSILILDDLAEFNIERDRAVTGSVTFTNASRTITGTGTAFKTEFRPRDWIGAIDQAERYEILEVVSDTSMLLRTAYSTATQTSEALRRNVSVVNAETVLSIDTYGLSTTGVADAPLIRNASQVVKDLLVEQGLESKLNTASFDEAAIDNSSLMSLMIPLEPLGSVPKVRDVLDLINVSIFGNLHKNKDFEIEFTVLEANKEATNLKTILDDDIIDFSVKTNSQNIVRTTTINYRHVDANPITGDPDASVLNRESEIAEKLIKTKRIKQVNVYLFEDADAQVILQRYAFLNEISQSVVEVRTKLKLSDLNINDIVFFKLDRLYTRFGTVADQNKIGIISALTTDGEGAVLEIDDLSGWFYSVATITENTADDYANANVNQRALNGYLTGLNELVNNIDATYRTNLIG